MNITNFEFKAKTNELYKLEKRLIEINPIFKGEDLLLEKKSRN